MTLAFPYYVHELSFVTFYGYTSQYLYSYFPDTIKLWCCYTSATKIIVIAIPFIAYKHSSALWKSLQVANDIRAWGLGIEKHGKSTITYSTLQSLTSGR